MSQICRNRLLLQKLYSTKTVYTQFNSFSTTQCMQELRKLAVVKVVDNSALGKAALDAGKPGRIIHVYNQSHVATIGDQVLLAIKGEKIKALVVGCKQKQKSGVPRFDSNNVVLLDETGNPLGTRITVPLPSAIKEKDVNGQMTKLFSIAPAFL